MAFKMQLQGDWKNASVFTKGFQSKAKLSLAIGTFLLREAETMRRFVLQGFINQGLGNPWRKLSPWTIAGRRLNRFGGTKALIHTAEMLKSVSTVISPDGLTAFCGIMYQTKRPGGQSAVNIAKVQEFGYGPVARKITPKMARYIGLLLKYMPDRKKQYRSKGQPKRTGNKVMIVRIPPRPFMGPARPAFMVGAEQRMIEFFAIRLPKGDVPKKVK